MDHHLNFYNNAANQTLQSIRAHLELDTMISHDDRCTHKFTNSSVPTWNIVRDALFSRPIGRGCSRPNCLVDPYLSHQLPGLLKEHQYDLNDINKIFAAKWLNHRQVVVGTKCNKLLVLDLLTNRMVRIPMLPSSSDRQLSECPCGIHSIAINPSRTLLATGGDNVNDVAIYRLPTFDPVCVGECGHDDWIFDLMWLDDQIVVSGSRDSQMALWRVKDDIDNNCVDMNSLSSFSRLDDIASCDNLLYNSQPSPRAESCYTRYEPSAEPLQVPTYRHIKPLCIKLCEKAEKVRAFAYNEHKQELAVLSLNAVLHLWDARTFTQKRTKRLRHLRENVCLSVSQVDGVYAVGSQSNVTLVDERMLKEIGYIQSKQRGCGVRSLNFIDSVLTIGTGAGAVYFYDRRVNKYLELNCSHPCSLTAGPGWLRRDETYREFFAEQEYPNAIYVHCFDESKTKIFAAGGPLPAGLWGNYAALWQ